MIHRQTLLTSSKTLICKRKRTFFSASKNIVELKYGKTPQYVHINKENCQKKKTEL